VLSLAQITCFVKAGAVNRPKPLLGPQEAGSRKYQIARFHTGWRWHLRRRPEAEAGLWRVHGGPPGPQRPGERAPAVKGRPQEMEPHSARTGGNASAGGLCRVTLLHYSPLVNFHLPWNCLDLENRDGGTKWSPASHLQKREPLYRSGFCSLEACW
jgi:hypothetical protein